MRAILFFSFLLFSYSVFSADQPEFAQGRLATHVRLVLRESYTGALGIGGYKGLGLMFETKDTISNKPAFVATVTFRPSRDEPRDPSYWRNCESMVQVKYLEGLDYFSANREYNGGHPFLVNDRHDDIRAVDEHSLEFRKIMPTFMKDGDNIDSYTREEGMLENAFFQFNSPPISFNGLKQIINNMRTRVGNLFPYYNKAGYSFYKDSINCIGFCLRVLHNQLNLHLPAESPLAVYLNHDYSRGFKGWLRVRFGSGVGTLTLEYALKELFQKNAHGEATASSIPGMRVVDITEGIPPVVVKRLWRRVTGIVIPVGDPWPYIDGAIPTLEDRKNLDIAHLFSQFGALNDRVVRVFKINPTSFRT